MGQLQSASCQTNTVSLATLTLFSSYTSDHLVSTCPAVFVWLNSTSLVAAASMLLLGVMGSSLTPCKHHAPQSNTHQQGPAPESLS